MRLVTQCPTCHTTFKVVRDQLRISDGWVRCGQCAEVFDAGPGLREIDVGAGAAPVIPAAPAAPAMAPSPAPPSPPAPMLEFPPPPEPVHIPSAVAFDDNARAEPDLNLDFLRLHEPTSESDAMPMDAFAREVDQLVSSLTSEPAPEVALAPAVSVIAPGDPGDYYRSRQSATAVPAERTAAPAPSFSFEAKAEAQSRWHRPWVRASLTFCALLLLCVLGLQVARHQRDYLAAAQPRLKPALQRMCELLSCRIRPWQHIDRIVVESSSFIKLKPDSYRLGFVLMNQDDVELARPAIELTLTDGQNVALVRRVLLPEQLSPRFDSFAAGSEWSGSYVVNLQAGYPNLAKNVTGYQLEPFYP